MAEYIKRTDALRVVDEVHGAKSAYHRIRDIPAADVTPVVHGRWVESVEIQTDTSTLYDYTCSVCSIVATRESPYCPNCGAHMKDGE